MTDKVSILVLDFMRPAESRLCLESIKKFANFDKEVIFCCNGGQNQDYAFDFYKEGLVDKLIINKENSGGGFGTVQLVNNSFEDYILWIECDCEFRTPIDQRGIDNCIRSLKNKDYYSIDLTGGISGTNTYSGRAFLMNREFYNSIDKFEIIDCKKIYGGPGPWNQRKYLEAFIQEYFTKNRLDIAHCFNIIKDNGQWSYREIGDGLYKHSTDQKRLFILKKPTYKTEEYPPFNDSEWAAALEGRWIDGDIPEKWKEHSFIYWK